MTQKPSTLTVLIPTRDRADTLVHCLKTVTTQTSDRLDILVSDNFSGPEVKAVVDAANDPRVRYIRTPERLGMSEHWDFALNHVTGDWVTILGDDDGLIPDAVNKFFAVADANPTIKAITSANCWFRWPTADENNGQLCLIAGKGYEIRDCKDYLKRTMHGEVISLPYVYTGGFVRMDLMNTIKSRSPDGIFFRSIIPDVYSSMAIASVTEHYIYSWEPWGIAGSSKHSNGRQHKNKSRNQMKQLDFHQENRLCFHPTLGDGCVESIQILLYESFLQSAHLRGGDMMGITLESQLELAMLLSGRRTKQDVLDYCKEVSERNNIALSPLIANAKRRKLGHRIQKIGRKLSRRFGFSKLPRRFIHDATVRNVNDAAAKLSTQLG